MNWRHGVLFISALCLVTAGGGPRCGANARRRSRRRQERSRSRHGIGDHARSMSATAWSATKPCAPARQRGAAGDGRQHQSVARPQFHAEARPHRVRRRDSYRDISIRLTQARSASSPAIRTRPPTRSRPRSRPSASAAPSSTSCPSAARPPWCCGTTAPRAVCTLSFQCTELTKPGDTAIITFAGRQDHHPEVQQPPWTFAQLRRRGRTLQHHPICRRMPTIHLSMTAAIPPACCAGADDGKIYPQFHPVARACRGGFAMLIPALTIPASAQTYSPSPTPTHSPSPSPRLHRPRRPRRADTDANAHSHADRFGFQRGIGQRSGQAALQPDDHQPRARHGAARHQRAGQLRRLRQRVRLGGIVLGRHPRPQEPDRQSGAAGGHRLHPVQRRRLQRHQRADRRVRAAL